jgi:malate dehydrogenase
MSFIAIIGAGDLGGAVAQALAALECAGEIRLIDPDASVAAGKALDIMQATAVEGRRARLTSSGDTRAAAGAAAIVLADAAGAPPKEWQGEEGLALLRRTWELAAAERSVLVCAGATQPALMTRAIAEAGVARRRLVGSASIAFEAAVRALVAAAADASGAEVQVMVLGLPPGGAVPCWSQATIGGASLTSRLTTAQLARLAERVPRLWPPGPYALGSAAARVAKDILRGSRRELTCLIGLDGEMGARRRVLALPVRLGPMGIERIVEPQLSGIERVKFENSLG